MRDLIVQLLTSLTAPFWTSSVSMDQFVTALQETLNMVFFSMIFGTIWGFVQGIALVATRPDGILPNKAIYTALNPIVNALRSLAFIIFMFAVNPLTMCISGSTTGT